MADPNFANVVSLLHFNSADGSTTFSDVKGFSWTPTGNAQLDTAQSRFGGSSAYFDGSGDYISVTNANLILGTGDFTIEAWIQRNADATHNIISWSGNNAIYMNAGANNIFVQIGGVLQTTTATPGLNAWFHFALCRNAGTLNVFVDGVKDSETPANTTNFTTGLFEIGRRSGSTNMFNGWIDEFRVTKGLARYTANFQPPLYPFSDTSMPTTRAYSFVS